MKKRGRESPQCLRRRDRHRRARAVPARPAAQRAQPQPAPATQPTLQNSDVPKISLESVPDYFSYSAADESRRATRASPSTRRGASSCSIIQGSAGAGPLYGEASTQLLEFDETGKFVREIGKGVYGLGYAHGARYDSTTTSGSSTRERTR